MRAEQIMDLHSIMDYPLYVIKSLMGAVLYKGRMASTSKIHNENVSAIKEEAPQIKYPSIVEIRKVIPNHCFESSLPLSMLYVLRDVMLVVGMHAAVMYSWSVLPYWTQYIITPLYWWFQGVVFTGIFVLGHDCGHGSFSNYDFLNDIFGTLLHGFLLVPYYEWKISHRNHHKNTGNIDKDEVFYPVREKQASGNGFLPGFGLGLAWFLYLIRGYTPRTVSHINPWESMFSRHVLGCVLSVLSVVGMGLLLYKYYLWYGLNNLLYFYGVPEFIFASFIVVITFLHHTDVGVVWYADGEWNYVKGQLSSIDRDYGHIHYLIHSIGVHQIHHLFSKIPHYRLEEATVHFQKTFPYLVRVNHSSIFPAFVKMFKKFIQQSVIKDDARVHVIK